MRFAERHPVNDKEPNVLQHDGSPPHYTIRVREFLNESFPNRWLGRGLVAWPPRSPDLTPLDYFLRGHMKTLVYETKIDSRDALRRRILLRQNR